MPDDAARTHRRVNEVLESDRFSSVRTDGGEIIAFSVESDLRDVSRSVWQLNGAQEISGAAWERPLDGAG